MEIRTCLMCGSRKIRHVRRAIRLGRGRRKVTIPNVPYHQCDACGERLYDRDSNAVIERHLHRRGARAR